MKKSRYSLVIVILFTFVIMALLVAYTTRLLYTTSFSYIHELGDDKTSAITADLENYLENAKSVLWVAADTVDHMYQNGATNEEIKEYITRESTNTEAQFDESYTGIYGVIRGEFVDGVGWVPPEDYDPTTRDWYKTTVAANGETVIISPYVDAQTGNVIISVGKSLSDPSNAMALDLTLAGIQELTQNIHINGNGYGFIMNYDGMVIAHHDSRIVGSYFDKTSEQKELFAKVMEVGKGNFDMDIGGEKCTVFVDEVMDQWHLVIVTKSSDLLDAPRNLLIVSVIVNLIVFGLISGFYIISYRYETKTSKRIEEMKEIERKREYEATVLKLEKSAADTANKAKSNFLADMSHEIRTPINAVLGMNEMILRESKDDNIIEYASNIKNAGNTLLSIINTILDFSKIEDGRMNLVPANFEVAALLNGLVNSISERAKAKELEFIVDVDPSVPSKLLGDDVRISQVIMNLLTNAVKYTERGSVTLTVANRGVTDDKVRLFVEVKDTGIGIKEEDMDKLSVSFERIEEKRNRHIEGTGLGISIVTKLLTMMDSKLQVESVYGEGSSFFFELELKITDKTPIGEFDAQHSSSADNKVSEIKLYAPNAKILVTDDNAMNLKVAINLMKLFGITPQTADSGRKAIEILKTNFFDVIFLDHMMPGMDGIETLHVLKDDNLIGDTPVIALTANAVVGSREQYIEAGFTDYLSKPINIEELEKMLRKYIPDVLILDEMEPETDYEVLEFAAEQGADSGNAGGYPLTISKASELGLNVTEGISFLGGDEDFYLEMLGDYASCADSKLNELDSYYNAADWKSYEILVHSIKSTSKTVGSSAVSEMARALEEASRDGNEEFIKVHHAELVESYRGLAKKILG